MFKPGEKIMIVDGMLTMRKLIAKVCTEIGITEIAEAANGRLAWEKLASGEEKIELVIADWQNTDGNGLDLLKRLRSDPRFTKLPFIMTSTVADPGQISQAMKAGVSSFLIKPFTAETLTEKISLIRKNSPS